MRPCVLPSPLIAGIEDPVDPERKFAARRPCFRNLMSWVSTVGDGKEAALQTLIVGSVNYPRKYGKSILRPTTSPWTIPVLLSL